MAFCATYPSINLRPLACFHSSSSSFLCPWPHHFNLFFSYYIFHSSHYISNCCLNTSLDFLVLLIRLHTCALPSSFPVSACLWLFSAKFHSISINVERCCFFVLVYSSRNFYAMSSYKFVTNGCPKSGACVVTPPTGYAVTTLYDIKCENFTDSDMPLSYRFAIDKCISGPGECCRWYTDYTLVDNV